MAKGENRLLIIANDANAYLELLGRQQLPGLSGIATATTAEEAEELCGDYNIIFGAPDLIRDVLPRAGKLVWAQSSWAGITPLLGQGCRTDYLLTGVKGVFGPVMSEYVFCHMLMHERKIAARRRSQAACRWDETRPGRLKERTIGIMGVGSIGAHIARTAKYFGMNTRGYTRREEGCPYIDAYCHGDELEAFAAGLDYLVSILPDHPATDCLIDETFLSAMEESAVLINVGRGNVVDDAALACALNEGRIAGAILDVFREEPLPAAHPFWKTKNLVVTSHTAAPSFPEDVAGVFIENYRNFAAGNPLNYVVDFKRGY